MNTHKQNLWQGDLIDPLPPHSQIAEDILRVNDGNLEHTEYVIAPKGNNDDPEDITSFVEGQEFWSEGNLPYRLGLLEQPYVGDLPLPGFLRDQYGKTILSVNGKPLR